MQKIATILFAALFHVSVFAETTQESILDWQFSAEVIELFAPPMDATIAEMRTWADRWERPIPADTEKWGGRQKYRERAALLSIDIAKQIIASKPDEEVLSSAWSMQWFPHFILAQQDKANIPQFENLYAEMKRQNDEWGRKFDRFTNNLMRTRGAVVRDLLEIDKNEKYLAWGKELIAEYDVLLEGKPLGKNVEGFYGSKLDLLSDLGDHAAADIFLEKIRELVNTRESELETVYLFYYAGPREPVTTPEGQAAHRAWMERLTARIAQTEDVRDRYHFYRLKGGTLRNLLDNNAATDAEFFAHAKELEAQADKEDSGIYLNDISNAYFLLFYRKFQRLLESGTITDKVLEDVFASARHLLRAGESAYGHGGRHFDMTFAVSGDALFSRCTPKQQAFYIRAFTDLLEETEKVEKEWIAAEKPMSHPSELPPLQNHLSLLQLFGKEVTLTGTTLDGKPFDLESLRGKVVLLDFWATTCAPCIAKMPELKELYEKYHASGFEIVGISCDSENNKERAVEVIKTRQLPWIQLHDPTGKLHQQFYGFGVPHCLLLDREGKLILLDARGEMLKQKLAEMF